MNKYIEYTKIKFYLSLITIKEYKSNFYASLFADIFNFIILMIFYMLYMDLTQKTFLDWTLINFITFFLITNFSTKLRNLLYFWRFPILVRNGHLNQLLTKPISTYYQIILSALKSGRLLTTMMVGFILINVILFNDYGNYFFAFIIWLLGFIGSLFLSNLIQILGFFLKKDIGLNEIHNQATTITRNFTFAPFENNVTLSTILLGIMPLAIVAYVTFNILNGLTEYFFNYILYFTGYALIMIILNLYFWKLGLKKYEAFG